MFQSSASGDKAGGGNLFPTSFQNAGAHRTQIEVENKINFLIPDINVLGSDF